jgi:hypothetical protein
MPVIRVPFLAELGYAKYVARPQPQSSLSSPLRNCESPGRGRSLDARVSIMAAEAQAVRTRRRSATCPLRIASK